ncbi:MAG TPA: SemiSWEET transporter [Burkholderiales bacterium]|nr:SemiSWEET transporter [Burkholderiales bacterium]
MVFDNILGFVAGILTTLAFVPQAWRVWKTRSVKDISLGMYIIFTSGVGLWLVYGIVIHSLPLILANSVTFVLAAFILIMKIRLG